MFLAALLTLLSLSGPAAADVALPDTTIPPPAQPPVDWSLTYDLSSLYSPRRGFGVGGQLRARHLGWTGSRWTLGAIVAQRYQRLGLHLFTADPYRARRFGMLGLYARTTTERPFFGSGPRTVDSVAVRFQLTTLEAEALLGQYAFDHTGLLVQPFARVRWDRVGRITEDAAALPLLDADSQGSVAAARDEDRTGAYLGLGLSTDTRDRPDYAEQGWLAQLSASRYVALDGSGLGFWQATGSLYGFFPVGDLLPAWEHHVVQLSLYATTRRGVDVAELPFYYLASVDYRTLGGFARYRLSGRDAFAATLSYRFPIPTLLDLVTDDYQTDAFVALQVGNAYNRIEDEFAARVSFASDLSNVAGRVPLRPVLVVGGALLDRARSDLLVTAQLSIGPEGFFASEVNLVYDLRRFRSLAR